MTDDRFTVILRGSYDVNGHRIVCPHCHAQAGLVYKARPVDTDTMVMCACGYDWWDERITGETLHDLHLALTGQPTRTTTVHGDGHAYPREECGECAAVKTELRELGVLASAADGDDRAELGARSAALLGAWCGHLAHTHLGTVKEAR